ncbi:UNVERIFIED_CONTAM: hypothetical protein FKN15_042702 [Acipenser sinensis]
MVNGDGTWETESAQKRFTAFIVQDFPDVRCGPNMWAITPEERSKHDKQFNSIQPLMGFVTVTFEDKRKENYQRGNAELEKRRQLLQEQQQREQERRMKKVQEERERWEREQQEKERKRQLEQERRIERQREIERQKEEERRKEMEHREAAKQELERQRKQEWEKTRRQELMNQRNKQQEDIVRLKAKKKSLEMELEAVGDKHKQISGRLRDVQNKKVVQKSELDLIDQKRDRRIMEINNLQQQLEGLRQSQNKQQRAIEQLYKIKEEKLREIERRKEQEHSQKRKAEEEAIRKAKQEKDNLWREKVRREEEERQKRMQEERSQKMQQEEELEAKARLRETQEGAMREQREAEEMQRKEEEERRRQAQARREKEEEQRRQAQARREAEEEKRRQEQLRKEAGERQRKKQEDEVAKEAMGQRRQQQQNSENFTNIKIDLQEKISSMVKGFDEKDSKTRGTRTTLSGHRTSAVLVTYRALYPFEARNLDELAFSASDLIEVDETTIGGEPGWLYGSFQGHTGWFPANYVEKIAEKKVPSASKTALLPPTVSKSSTSHSSGPLSPSKTKDETCFQQNQSLASMSGSMAWQKSAFTPTVPPGSVSPEHSQLYQDDGNHSNVNRRCDNVPLRYRYKNGSVKRHLVYQNVGECEEIVQVTTAYTATGSEQLSLAPGQLILILNKNPTGWWQGELQARGKKRQKGWFPGSHVKPLGAGSDKTTPAPTPAPTPVCQVIAKYDYAAMNEDELSFSKGQLISVLNKDDSDWWKGELNGAAGLFPSNYVQMTTESDPSQQLCQVIAKYDYAAMNEDELSFSKGQLISVLNKDDSDWWKGELNGAAGLFPSNYVQMTTESDPSQQWCADLTSLDTMSPIERKRQGYIHELIETEERYMDDLQLVVEVFQKPLTESEKLTESEMGMIFVNWKELIMSNFELLK